MKSVGFKRSNHDTCIYVNSKRNRVMTIANVYVDDLRVFSNDCSEKYSLKIELNNEFECRIWVALSTVLSWDKCRKG